MTLHSVDPSMRARLDDRPSYVPPFKSGEPLDGAAVGRVLVSRSSALAEGDDVLHWYGRRERVVLTAYVGRGRRRSSTVSNRRLLHSSACSTATLSAK